MKPRAFHLNHGESPSAAIGRLYRHIRTIKPDYQPAPKAVSRSNMRRMERAGKAAKPFLRLVKG